MVLHGRPGGELAPDYAPDHRPPASWDSRAKELSLVGVASWGHGDSCGIPDLGPSVYVRLANTLGWVRDTMASWSGPTRRDTEQSTPVAVCEPKAPVSEGEVCATAGGSQGSSMWVYRCGTHDVSGNMVTQVRGSFPGIYGPDLASQRMLMPLLEPPPRKAGKQPSRGLRR